MILMLKKNLSLNFKKLKFLTLEDLKINQSVYLPICLCAYEMPICLSTSLPTCLPACLSI